MSTPAIEPNVPPQGSPIVMPTLLGVGYHNYDAQPNNFIFSFLAHALILLLVVFGGNFLWQNRVEIKKMVDVSNVGAIILPPAPDAAGGGGGGGDMSKLLANKGKPPKFDMNRITPPVAVIKNDNPKLAVDQSVAVLPNIKMPTSQTQVGDPLSAAMIASNGTGVNSGVGNGRGGGLGNGSGIGLGPGSGGNTGGGVFRVGGGVSAPVLVYKPEPDFSEEARKAKYQGVVTVSCVVGPDGRIRDMQIVRPLGMGLDEKALEALKNWRFEPAKKDGVPVAVKVAVEVEFHLY
jgi:TonB family protein